MTLSASMRPRHKAAENGPGARPMDAAWVRFNEAAA